MPGTRLCARRAGDGSRGIGLKRLCALAYLACPRPLGGGPGVGMAHLSEHALVQTVEEERALFQRYYLILLHSIGVEERDDALTLELAKGMVDAVNFEPFPDTLEVVSLLRERGVRMVVVSNTWPSLDWKLRALGLREFFEALVISTQCGFEKPDPRIFLEGSRRMAIAPEHLLFVDDYAPHVAAAIELGFRGLVIRRDG
jgi:HAD superfamily hydrolase (TIGR01509 family)